MSFRAYKRPKGYEWGKMGDEVKKMKAKETEKYQNVTCGIITELMSACYAMCVKPWVSCQSENVKPRLQYSFSWKYPYVSSRLAAESSKRGYTKSCVDMNFESWNVNVFSHSTSVL